MKTIDIIKIIPFEESFRNEMLSKYNSLDEDQKYTIGKIVRDLYSVLYDLKLQENLDLALLEAKEKPVALDKNFYKRINEQTEKKMQEDQVLASSKVDLHSVQKELATMIDKSSKVN